MKETQTHFKLLTKSTCTNKSNHNRGPHNDFPAIENIGYKSWHRQWQHPIDKHLTFRSPSLKLNFESVFHLNPQLPLPKVYLESQNYEVPEQTLQVKFQVLKIKIIIIAQTNSGIALDKNIHNPNKTK